MIVPLEKPGTPEEIIHFGVKGMKWGVRKHVTGKRVAVGVFAPAVAVGAAVVAYRLRRDGNKSLSSIKSQTYKIVDEKVTQIYDNFSEAVKKSKEGR